MNLRRAENYTIGLDLGTNSVGWAVVDENGELYHIKGKPTWGSRLFLGADTAAATRLKRGQRRRYERRRQRLDALQGFFLEEMEQVDPTFFVRLRQSRLLKEDKREDLQDYAWPFFNASDFTEADYYERFPTIYHLRNYLMHSSEKEDLRLIYLALHNIVKYRGNFLHEDEGDSLRAANANAARSAEELAAAMIEYLGDVRGIEDAVSLDAHRVERALDERGVRRGDRAEALLEAFSPRDKQAKDFCKGVSRACVGYKVNFASLFEGVDDAEGANFALGDEEKLQAFQDEICPDDARHLFDAIQSAYSAYILSGILQGEESLSAAMIRSYERHHEDLVLLKGLFRDHLTKEQYNEFFRGVIDDRGNYDINKLSKGSYTSYIAGEKKANKLGTTHEELIKKIRALCDANDALREDARYKEIEGRLAAGDECDFLLKQKTRSNGAIPYQLHLEEARAIISTQKQFYPFLAEHGSDIEKLISSRIPYYVGPLNGGHDPKGYYANNNVDKTRKYAWSVRKPGMEAVKAYPWNVDEVIDTDETATRFIQRMTGTCSYLYGEPVLPRHSLLYEEFCVLNELNGTRWGAHGGKTHRFDRADKELVFTELFKNRKSAAVNNSLLKKWICENRGVVDAEVAGNQGETGFESKLTTYHDFCKILGVRNLEEESPLTMDELEEIVLWNTVFEDRAIFKRKMLAKYGPDGDGRLTVEQIKKLVNKRYTGWGRLSKKFLTGVRVHAPAGMRPLSIMDVLRSGNPFGRDRQLVLMEVLADKDLCFQQAIDEENKDYFAERGDSLSIDDMQGSPANRRSVNQAMRILDELIGIAGKAPARICIEVTRDDDWQKKGSRTKSRYNQLKEALKSFKEDVALLADLNDNKDNLDDDRLLLYFEQRGKSMYSGKPLDINKLSTYQIDHILPQSYIKDDSIDNRVLVKSDENQRKLDSLLLDDGIINHQLPWWKELKNSGLMSEKKFNLLTCRNLDERQITGFINRQLVETSQIVKFVRQMCEQKYPGTEVVSVRANVSHGVRDNLELVKCRELNNYHHAHDAFVACQVADFVGRCYPKWQDGFQLTTIRKYIKNLKGDVSPNRTPGRSGFIADSMTHITHFNDETGEVLWDHAERDAYIKKALGYRTCFISRMTEINTSGFWDETVYSPRDTRNGKSLFMPLKSSKLDRNAEGYLDPRKYGGVSSVKQAYWFIFAAKDKNGRNKFFFEGVPMHLAGTIGEGLQEYADELAQKAGCGKATILRDRVPLRQKFELDGTPYYLYGAGEIRAARELVLDADLVWRLFNTPENVAPEDSINLFDALADGTDNIFPDINRRHNLAGKRDVFVGLSNEDRVKQLKQLVLKLNGTSQFLDLTLLGEGKFCGLIKKSFNKELQHITWIDQSVTGVFEKRTTFEDLCRGL